MDNLAPFEEAKIDIVIGGFNRVPNSLKTNILFSDPEVIADDDAHS